MDLGALIPILAITLIFGPKLFSEVKDYLLKKEQLKADTELRAEALRLKNSLELEQFINSGSMPNSTNSTTRPYTQQNVPNDGLNVENSDNLNQKRNSQYERY